MTDVEEFHTHMRVGWTLIELIFIIIIIGILAALALPKLAATRDDAKLSTIVHNMGVCIKDTNAYYLATGIDYNATSHPNSCDLNNTICYDFTYAVNGFDFNVTIDPTGTDLNGDTHLYCSDIENVGGHLAGNYDFGGSRIIR